MMQSILLHVQDDASFDSRFKAALTLGKAFDGHISCLHASPYGEYLANDPFTAMVLPVDFSKTMERIGRDMRVKVEAHLSAEDAKWAWHHVDDIGVDSAILQMSPIVDVIVMSLDTRPKAHKTVAAVASKARAPVLAIPSSAIDFDPSGVAAIAWNGSAESSVALRASLPLLRKAASVHLIEIEDRSMRIHNEQGAHYLAQHGIEVRVVHRSANSSDAGGAILKATEDVGADLLVMGAYSHSRTAEFIVGGATRTVLANSRIPLLLAH
jgi:nucleotide-binding universal stress UspA family protein